MDIYNALFASLVLLFAFACILWGLRIFKIFLVVLGLWLGFGTGIFVGDFLAESSSSLIWWGVGGAVIFALLAWPLQKLFVFSGVGVMVAFLVFAMVMSRGGEPESGLIAAATVFIIAGFIAVMIYDYFVIVLMSFVSAYLIIDICFLPYEFKNLIEVFLIGKTGSVSQLRIFGGYYSELIWPSLAVLVMVIWFGIYMQKILPEKRAQDKPERKLKRGVPWKTTFVYAAVLVGYALYDWAAGHAQSLYKLDHWQGYFSTLNNLSPGSYVAGFCHTPVLNISPISFALASYISFTFIKLYKARGLDRHFRGIKWINGAILGLSISLVILPLVEMLTIFALTRFEDFALAGQYWLGHYASFVVAPMQIIVFKWLYSVVLLPLLIIFILPSEKVVRPDADRAEKKINYCI